MNVEEQSNEIDLLKTGFEERKKGTFKHLTYFYVKQSALDRFLGRATRYIANSKTHKYYAPNDFDMALVYNEIIKWHDPPFEDKKFLVQWFKDQMPAYDPLTGDVRASWREDPDLK